MANFRIKELAKEKGLSMVDIAQKIGISPVNLSASLNGNPTLARLQEVAGILNCNVSDLFVDKPREVWGHLDFNGKTYRIESLEDLLFVTEKIKTLYDEFGIPKYQTTKL